MDPVPVPHALSVERVVIVLSAYVVLSMELGVETIWLDGPP